MATVMWARRVIPACRALGVSAGPARRMVALTLHNEAATACGGSEGSPVENCPRSSVPPARGGGIGPDGPCCTRPARRSRSPLNYYVPGLLTSVCLGGVTLPTTGTGRPRERGRVAPVGPEGPLVEWAIGRTRHVSAPQRDPSGEVAPLPTTSGHGGSNERWLAWFGRAARPQVVVLVPVAGVARAGARQASAASEEVACPTSRSPTYACASAKAIRRPICCTVPRTSTRSPSKGSGRR